MKSNEKSQSLLLNYKCKYNHFVMAYNNAAYSVHFFRDFNLYKHLSYPIILNGDLKRKGTKFILRRPDLGILMFYEILESTVTDYYSRFKFLIYKTNPETFNYIHLVEVRYINEDQFDIRSSLIYDNKIFLSEKELQKTLRLKYMIYKQIEISLSNYYMKKLVIVYTVFNNKIELIWDILINMKLLHKYSFILADKINYKGNVLKKNDIIELIENNKNDGPIKCNAKVKKCKISSMDNNLTKEGIIELLFENLEINNLPIKKTKIYLRIYECEGKCTMYILYYFLNNQSFKFLGNLTRMKIKELEKLKNIIEKYIIYNSNKIEKIK